MKATNINEVTPSDAGMEYTPLKIKPDPNCKACLGTGEVDDWVDYGSTTVSMPSICDCVLEQIPEGEEDREVQIIHTCHVCKGTGADPMSDIVNWLPCQSCGGTGVR